LTDKKESWFDAVADIRKFHPVALALTFATMCLASYILRSGSPLEEKILLFLLAFMVSFITILFELYRIQKNKSEKEGVIWRKQGDVN